MHFPIFPYVLYIFPKIFVYFPKKTCFQAAECGKYHPIMFIRMVIFDLKSDGSSLKFTSINPSGEPDSITSFDNLNKPTMDTWYQLQYSSVIFEFTSFGNDSFHFNFECRRYYLNDDLSLDVFAAYNDKDFSDSYCTKRGMTEGFDSVCVTNVTFPEPPVTNFYGTWIKTESCDETVLMSQSPLTQNKDYIFHVHTCESNEFVYFKLEENHIQQLPQTYLVMLAPSKDGIKIGRAHV